MIEVFFENFNISEIWESILLRLNSLFDPENFQFLNFLNPFWDKVLENPLASIITVLALIGLPYTLLRAKTSNTQASERLDLLMGEMKDFEYEKPLIDLQEKFKHTPLDNTYETNYGENVLELNHKKDYSEFSIEADSDHQDMESSSFAKQISLDQETTDDFLSTNSMDLKTESNDEDLDASFWERENSREFEVGQPVEPSNIEAEYVDKYFEELQISDEDRELISLSEGIFDEADVDSQEQDAEEQIHASPEPNDLSTMMEQAIKKLRLKYPAVEEKEESTPEKIDAETVPPVIEAKKKLALQGGKILNENVDTFQPRNISTPPDSLVGGQEKSLDKSDVITHLKSFQKNLENRFDPNLHESETRSPKTPQEQNSTFKPTGKPAGITSPPQNISTDKEYQESLESFIFLKDQKKPE